jgi:hypothetical protein
MKKFLTGMLALLIGASVSMAQTTTPAKTAKKEKPKTEQKAVSDTTKRLKKDGTPDKRFKENKKAEGPKKKDGTPDKRYKANQES